MKRLLLVVAAAALSVHAAAASAGDAVLLKADAGLGGWCRPGRWTPVRVAIDYRGGDAAGEVVVEWGDARVRRDVALSAVTRKQIELYVRAPDVRDSMTVRLIANGRELATTDARVRVAAPADPFAVCVGTESAWAVEGVTCSTTIPPAALPRSWRGYEAADEVVWPAGDTRVLSVAQQNALRQWKAVYAIENSEMLSVAPPILPSKNDPVRGALTAAALYGVALAVLVWPLARMRSRSLAVYPMMVALVIAASAATLASGRIGAGGEVRVAESAVAYLLPGGDESFVVARALADFSTRDRVILRAGDADGALGLKDVGRGRDLQFDEGGAPVLTGVYALGARTNTELEAVVPFAPMRVTAGAGTLRVSNASSAPLHDCRLPTAYSRSSIDVIRPGEAIDVPRRSSDSTGNVVTCVVDRAPVGIAGAGGAIPLSGRTVVVAPLSRPEPSR